MKGAWIGCCARLLLAPLAWIAEGSSIRSHGDWVEERVDFSDGGPYLIVEVPGEALFFEVSRTSLMEYRAWRENVGPPETAGVPTLYRFGLEVPWDEGLFGTDEILPRQVVVEEAGIHYHALQFTRNRDPRHSRILYVLEGWDDEDGWLPVAGEFLGDSMERGDRLERVTLRDELPLIPGEERRLRLRVRYEPVPTFFAHYMSDLNPGWSAMAYLTQPMPAYFRLFHDRPDLMQPVPAGPDDTFASTGGVHRDLPLLPPGFSFSSAVESAELEIRRARRAGVDGFAVNCLGGNTDFLEALFEAAAALEASGSDFPPFLVSLSLDINVIPHEERKLLSAVSDLIATWLEAGARHNDGAHLARRGGKPMVMGYQSHWIWFDYLQRLFEIRELEDGAADGWTDERLRWPTELGAPPPAPHLPVVVIEAYRERVHERFAELEELSDPWDDDELRADLNYFQNSGLSLGAMEQHARESTARRHARREAARTWARHPDGWQRMREAYELLERLVGEELFWQFDAVDMDDFAEDPEEVLEVVAQSFPAVNMFLPKGGLTDLARTVVRRNGAEWGEPIYAQYVAYGQNERDGLFWGNAHGGDGTQTFRQGWYQAMGGRHGTASQAGPKGKPDERSSLIHYTTWNDYGEHTHMAPSLQMRYALTELSRYFISLWKTGEPPADMEEQLFLFYRKYPEESANRSFPFWHSPDFHPARFEVITILHDEGRLELLGEDPRGQPVSRAGARRVDAGLSVESFEGRLTDPLWREGGVAARVVKRSGEKLSVKGWEEITHRPFRQDYTLVGASSRCEELWREDMPDPAMRSFSYSEYGDDDGDSMPNWFEMFYFGQGWLSVEDRIRADPDRDDNRDGRSNLEHYRAGTNPVFFSHPFPYRQDRLGQPSPIQIHPGSRTRIPAEHFDRGGLGVAYGRHTFESMLGGPYRDFGNEVATHRRVDAHEEDGGDWIMAPLADGEWLKYTLEIPAGCYRLTARVREGGGSIHVELQGKPILTSSIEDRGLWSTQELGRIVVSNEQAGVQRLRLIFESPGYGLNWFQFEPCDRR